MSRFKKLIWGVFGLLLIVLSAFYLAFIYNLGVGTTMMQAIMENEIGRYVLTGLLGLVLLGGIIMLFSAMISPSLRRQLWLQQPKGRLKISKSAVVGLVQQSLAHHFNLADINVEPKLIDRQKKVALKIDAFTFNDQDLSQQSNQIREQVMADVQDYLGVPVKKVNLHLKQAANGQKVPVI